MTKTGTIRAKTEQIRNYATGEMDDQTFFEIFNGSRWIGKAYTMKRAVRYSAELKANA